jgi:hypothetical protein
MNDNAIDSSGKGHIKTYHFFVDGAKYETEQASITGGAIKGIAGVDPAFQLFLEGDENAPDSQVSDAEAFDLTRATKHFYSVPPATFGA